MGEPHVRLLRDRGANCAPLLSADRRVLISITASALRAMATRVSSISDCWNARSAFSSCPMST